ncbi:potassium uptake protein, TrkH family [Halobacillus karajensis]|uniref:Ktr system potassium uptake protein B n=1 Tax=Halobacillus karajensis TaxID=195088 RepID=A0A024P2C5_9BACI|nr:TrkH family potassium uptake protein [Halobacillus karajensis]CDQ19964.1 Ktr system potassium uptake protein B [Halobacillus karajensis]CDQ22424.1 Ktr system potassium uptake protein B [Halobacillus karajensis]CDQ28267.1 Ktr system potassium uptake protein B [Halobacillus karajensis]SEH69093.1 potassium uptake protein, TrkH family [Halobacillus karajensis]
MWVRRKSLMWLNDLSPFQLIALYYMVAVTIASILIALPVAHRDGVDLAFIDVLFTAVSAVSVTGLTTVPTAETFSTTGYFIIAIVLQFGGIGIMTLGTMIWLMLGKKIGLKERRLIMTDQNQTTFQGMVRLVKQIILVVLMIEFIGFLVLGTYFLQYYEPGEAYLQGFFGTISAMTNGGFDITGESLIPFRDDYFVQFINIVLIIAGAIGFPVLIEVKQYLWQNQEEKTIRFSLFAKLTTITFFALVLFGTLMIIILENNHFFAGRSWHEILFYALFQSVTTRSGGLATLDINQFTEQTQLFMSSLMFIGASPSSVGGGIRTTTFALVVIFVLTFARGGQNIRIFRREIHPEDLNKAVVVTMVALFLCFIAVITLSIIEPFTLNEIVFEVCSAFGTVGLSMGITPGLSTFGKIILMLLMFLGRIGLLTFLFSFNKHDKARVNYHYPRERIIIG